MARLEKITIRKAAESDLPSMIRIMDEALGNPTIDDKMEQRVELWLTRFNNKLQFIFYVAEADDENLVGWCCGGPTMECHQTVAHQIYDCEITHIFIRQQYQHRGIGRELWKIVWNDILLRFHPKNFVVWSVDNEQAHRFYVSLGSVQAEKRKFGELFLTAFIWSALKPFEFTNFLIFI
ncbi:unnamed protein product [Didymodactylos carnosus]|uniref:N-acetyltransferase domain-containing protein n=1 Tax=Didymodactylos carnosus TaxID=1234261 RepID=A0A815WY69_9BILA|nr:unnamed protein product [Didymodactylos carnosus]CAF1550350.1 unnamed protein product [Didymodactylos carnosus]CAF3980374.1 unnamed protein product [Didymodactylos carnosus]CAF4411299.1 unnamed protein product [Didymodactylos carnosus]